MYRSGFLSIPLFCLVTFLTMSGSYSAAIHGKLTQGLLLDVIRMHDSEIIVNNN